MFCDSNPWVFAIIDLNQHAFLVLKGVTPTFSNFGILLQIDIKNCPLLGKLLSVWRTVSVLPKSALSAQSAQMVENSHSFFNVSYTWYKSLGAPFSFSVEGRGCWSFCRKSISISVLFKVLTGGSTWVWIYKCRSFCNYQ